MKHDEAALYEDIFHVTRFLPDHFPVISDDGKLQVSMALLLRELHLLSIFALSLAGIGLYGVISFSVGQRMEEIACVSEGREVW